MPRKKDTEGISPRRENDVSAVCARAIVKARRILVVTGAGISCSAGIPDFRSQNGLYDLVKKEYPKAVLKGRDLFDAILFNDPVSTAVFCTFMARLRSQILEARSTSVHKFIRVLRDKKKLLRCYTQNIDGLESQDGLKIGVEGKIDVVQLHGDIHVLKCTVCGNKASWSEEDTELLQDGSAPECRTCCEIAEERTSAGKRCPRVGALLPNIVLYGTDHPDGEDIGNCIRSDIKARPDCLVIAGTSLKVHGIKQLVRTAAKAVHASGGTVIYVNKTPPGSVWGNVIDHHIESDCDAWVADLRARQPQLFMKQTTLVTKKQKAGVSLNAPKDLKVLQPACEPNRKILKPASLCEQKRKIIDRVTEMARPAKFVRTENVPCLAV